VLFLEWLRACRGLHLPDAGALAAWRRDAPDAFADVLADFAGLDTAAGWRANLLRWTGPREALVVRHRGACRAWTRDALRAAQDLPAPVAEILARTDVAGLLALAASHLLDAETRPDDRLLWTGDPADPWPYGAWLVGATVILGSAGDAPAEAAAEAVGPPSSGHADAMG
jgi:hypothetical protein